MLQMPNIIRKPVIWLPAIFASIILGPISTCIFGMTNNAPDPVWEPAAL